MARVLVKLENERPLGNFKLLGGLYAGLRLLADHASVPMSALVRPAVSPGGLPRLICASDGNHGLAVAAAAWLARAPATVFLHGQVDPRRAARIAATGARIISVPGTYDDAVDGARAAARDGGGLLVPDIAPDADDPVVRPVMAGYRTLTDELSRQLPTQGALPSHAFIQAGVGGLAAACADAMARWTPPPHLAVVEPRAAACVRHALASGRVERIGGTLDTAAEMLSCGLASAPAIDALRRYGVAALAVGEAALLQASARADAALGIRTTPSGAAGLAGLLHVARDDRLRRRHELGADSVVLLIVTEAAE